MPINVINEKIIWDLMLCLHRVPDEDILEVHLRRGINQYIEPVGLIACVLVESCLKIVLPAM
jgi:hypothetical protein